MEKKYRKLVNNAVFIRNKSLFFVSAAATSGFRLEHTPGLLRSVSPGGYQIRTIEYGKILVVLVYGEYYMDEYTWYIINTYICICICICVYIYIYIYREREFFVLSTSVGLADSAEMY